jgi:hypothetical protein
MPIKVPSQVQMSVAIGPDDASHGWDLLSSACKQNLNRKSRQTDGLFVWRWPTVRYISWGLRLAEPLQEIYAVSQDINVLALVKGTERYVFLYDDTSRAETLRTLGRFASNPELSFTWYDAAVLSQKIRQDSHKFVSASRFEVPLPSDMDEYC